MVQPRNESRHFTPTQNDNTVNAGPKTDIDCDEALESLADQLRLPTEPDAFEDESACRAVNRLVREIGREPVGAARQEPTQGGMSFERLGQYQLLEKLGEGGMGTVYKALHTKLDKVVALKVLSSSKTQDAQAVSRFEREMKAVGKLEHPNIVRAMDAGEWNGAHYLVMEYVPGLDLAQLVKDQGPLPIGAACELVRQAANGLQAAHAAGMIHRDVKPSNLILALPAGDLAQGEPPTLKILDLGLALLANSEGGEEITGVGQVMGTISYMAPEQGDNSHGVDHRADIYSLGATLYKLLTGQAIFQHAANQSAVQQILALATQPAPPIQSRRDDLPDDLAAIVHTMIAKNPAERYASMSEVAQALAAFADPSALVALAGLPGVYSNELLVEASTLGTDPHHANSLLDTSPAWNRSALSQASTQPSIPPVPAPKTAKHRRQFFRIGAALAAIGVALGVILFSLSTPHGKVVVELADGIPAEAAKNLKIEVSGAGHVKVADAAAGWNIDIAEGQYQARLASGGDQFQLEHNQVTVTRGEKTLLKVSLIPSNVTGPAGEPLARSEPDKTVGPAKPAAAAKPWQPTPEQQAFIDEVAKLPAEAQVDAVAKKLQEINPGFDGNFKHVVEGNHVTDFSIKVFEVNDLWPVRALPALSALAVTGDTGRRGKLSDLSPLRGMTSLRRLNCSATPVSDLSPLAGLQLTSVTCNQAPLSNLSPLAGMALRDFSCLGTPVSDLSPLAGMPLTSLTCKHTQVTNLSPLKGMPLVTLECSNTGIADLSPLKGMPLKSLSCSFSRVADLAPLAGMPLNTLNCYATRISDLSPLAGMPLRYLSCEGGRLYDFSPLAGLPLLQLSLSLPLFHEPNEQVLKGLALRSLGWRFYTQVPPEEFWREFAARKVAAEQFAAEAAKLPAEEQWKAVIDKLRSLRGGANIGALEPVIGEGVIVEATFTLVGGSQDLSPLRALADLKKLTINGQAYALDLSPINNLPLERLTCGEVHAQRNAVMLQAMDTLKTINGQPKGEYLKNLRPSESAEIDPPAEMEGENEFSDAGPSDLNDPSP